MATASPHALQPGTRIETFEIRRILGAGGFGITYQAWDHQLECEVAIKEYLPSSLAGRANDHLTVSVLASSDENTQSYEAGLTKFLDEARVLAKFRHPNLVGVKQFLSANGTAYMVMDYEKGQSLAQYLRENPPPLPEEQVIALLGALLSGLSTLHADRVLHRDIKPANIYLRETGEPVLLDFGSARRRVQQSSTQEMTSMVSLGYAPHEQYHKRGHQGPWTDLYSLGATLYFCLTGARPVDGMDRFLAMHETGKDIMPSLVGLATDHLDENRCAVIDWMLRVPVEDRPRSVADVEAALAGAPIPEPSTQPEPAATENFDDGDATMLLDNPRIATAATADAEPENRKFNWKPLAIGAALLAVVTAVTPFWANSQLRAGIRDTLLAELASVTPGMEWQLDSVEGSVFGGEVRVFGLRVANPAGFAPGALLQVSHLRMFPASDGWWHSEPLDFDTVYLSGLEVHVSASEDERTNLSVLLAALNQSAAGATAQQSVAAPPEVAGQASPEKSAEPQAGPVAGPPAVAATMLRTASFELAPGLLTLDQAKQDEPLHRPLPPLTSPPDGAGTGITLAALSNWTLRRIGELVADATPPPPSAEKKPVPVEAKSKPVKPAAVAAEPEEKKSDPISRITDRVKGLFKRNRSSDDTKSGGGG